MLWLNLGETDGFGVSDHVNSLEHYIGKDEIDVVIASNTEISEEMATKYADEEQKEPVKIDYDNIKKHKFELIEDDLVTISDGTIKHNSLKLSADIFSYLMRWASERAQWAMKRACEYAETIILDFCEAKE